MLEPAHYFMQHDIEVLPKGQIPHLGDIFAVYFIRVQMLY